MADKKVESPLRGPLAAALMPEEEEVNPTNQRIEVKIVQLQGIRAKLMEQLAGIDNQVFALDVILHPERDEDRPEEAESAPNDTPPGTV